MGFQFELDPTHISVPLGSPSTNTQGQTLVWTGTQAYVQNPDGSQTVIAAPGSATVQMISLTMGGTGGAAPMGNSTSVQALNNRGCVVGSYTDANGGVHGFYYDGQGNYTTIDVFQAKKTWVQGIDDFGNIRGVYVGSDGFEHSFVGVPSGFNVSDQTQGTNWADIGIPYQGPVKGLTTQELLTGLHNYNMTAALPDVFMHTGAGDDAIKVLGGNNVVDGGTGSNFLVGSSGNDQFFVDDRHANADTWSTVSGFHSGDTAIIWGITPDDFKVWRDNEGAAGYAGLTVHVGHAPTASMTLTGFGSSDLEKSLQVTYGRTGDLPGVPGSEYMMIHAT